MSTIEVPKVSAIAPFYGSNRMLASHVGRALEGCSFVAIPFAGSMSEVPYITARTIVINDLHRHVINCARVARDPVLGPKLYRRLKRRVFHPDELVMAQWLCQVMEQEPRKLCEPPYLAWAEAYFVSAWMGRNGKAGTKGEFRNTLAVRWDAAGGDSVVRYRSAVRSLVAWRRVLARATFVCMDAFDMIAKVKDKLGHGLYVDSPWPDDGDQYTHSFTEDQQRRLAEVLSRFRSARVVVRFGNHPLVRELYPADRWDWTERDGRTAANRAKAEVLITNRAG